MSLKPQKVVAPDLLAITYESVRLSVLWASAVAKAVGIHPTDLFAIAHLLGSKSATAGELMAVTGLTSGATSAMIDRLQRAHVVTRARDLKDARRVIVRLVRPPERVKLMRSITDRELKGALSQITDETMRQMLSGQQKTNEALQKSIIKLNDL